MKRIILTVTGLMLAVGCVYFLFFQTSVLNGKNLFGQQDGSKQPKIQFEKTEHDFGTITEGESVEYIFKFSNAGTDTLVITNVRASCGCTAALVSERVLAPGKSGEIKAVFDSHGRPGKNSKTIAVISNDTNRQQVILRFTVMVEEKSDKRSEMETLFK